METETTEKKEYTERKSLFRLIADTGAPIIALLEIFTIGDIIFKPSDTITAEDLKTVLIAFIVLAIIGIFYRNSVKRLFRTYESDDSYNQIRFYAIAIPTVYLCRITFIILEAYKWFSYEFNLGIVIAILAIGLYIALKKPKKAKQVEKAKTEKNI